MSATTAIAYGFIGAAFVSFFIMATIAYGHFAVKAWRETVMSVAVLLILLVIMKRATDIVTAERAAAAERQQEMPAATPGPQGGLRWQLLSLAS